MKPSDENKIAVAMTVYRKDNLRYFQSAVQSLFDQSYQNFELILGIDGPLSVDMENYVELLRDQNNVEVNYYEENRGLTATLNDLLVICDRKNYKFIARMDADDISFPDRFEKQINFLLANDEVDIVGCAIEEIDENDNSRNKIIRYPLSHSECLTYFKYRNPLAHPGVLIRNRFFSKIGHFYRSENRYNQDTILWMDGFISGCIFSNLSEVLLKFRITGDFFRRRDGFGLAVRIIKDRFAVNRALHFNLWSYLYAIILFGITISPHFVKRFFYKIR